MTAGVVSIGPGLVQLGVQANDSSNQVFGVEGFFDAGNSNPTTLGGALIDNEYYSFPITVQVGFNIFLTSISCTYRSTEAVPDNYSC